MSVKFRGHFLQKPLTKRQKCGKIYKLNVERYRSGHNEAVLKTVCPKGRVGSNPTLSVIIARSQMTPCNFFLTKTESEMIRYYNMCTESAWRSTQEAEGAPLERE